MHDEAPPKAKPSPPSKEDRLAAALRANLNRRKQLLRSKKGRETIEPDAKAGEKPREPK